MGSEKAEMTVTVQRPMTRVDRSPMNPKVWCVQLACGHDVWITGRKPRMSGKLYDCDRCSREINAAVRP